MQRRERLTHKWQEREETFVQRAAALQNRFPDACEYPPALFVCLSVCLAGWLAGWLALFPVCCAHPQARPYGLRCAARYESHRLSGLEAGDQALHPLPLIPSYKLKSPCAAGGEAGRALDRRAALTGT